MPFPQWGSPQARSAQTSIKCHDCQHPLTVQRACRQVSLYCEKCDKHFPLQQYIAEMDDTLEHFMENVYCDRV